MAKTHQIWGGHHTLHAIGAVVEGAHTVGTKTWAHTAGGATPLVTLWNSETGKLEAIIEAFALGPDAHRRHLRRRHRAHGGRGCR